MAEGSFINKIQIQLFVLYFGVNSSGVVSFYALLTFFLTHSPSFMVAFFGTLWLSNPELSPECSCQGQPSWCLRLIPELAGCLWATWLSSHLALYACKGVSNVTVKSCLQPLQLSTFWLTCLQILHCVFLVSRVIDLGWWCIYWMPLQGARRTIQGLGFLLNFILDETLKFYHRNTFLFPDSQQSQNHFHFLQFYGWGFKAALLYFFSTSWISSIIFLKILLLFLLLKQINKNNNIWCDPQELG